MVAVNAFPTDTKAELDLVESKCREPVSYTHLVSHGNGFGNGINMRNAVNIGMFPDIPIEKFHYIGNSSLTGAYTMILSTQAERKTYEVAQNMTYLELSTVPTYMDEFVASCFLPHTDSDIFPSVVLR